MKDLIEFIKDELDEELLELEYSGYLLKKITSSSAISVDKPSKGYHIEITDTVGPMNLFPVVTSAKYLSTRDTDEKRRYTLKLPVAISAQNFTKVAQTVRDRSASGGFTLKARDVEIEYLKNQVQSENHHNEFTICTFNRRTSGQDQSEIGTSKDSKFFIGLRSITLPNEYLLFLKVKKKLKYVVLSLPSLEEIPGLEDYFSTNGNFFISEQDKSEIDGNTVNELIEQAGTDKKLHETSNVILYGPPGTGKTRLIRNELIPNFVQSGYEKTKEDFEYEKISTLPWWKVFALILLEETQLTVPEIKEHRFTKYRLANSNTNSLNQTVWGQLSSHTVEDSETVEYSDRVKPLIFDKTAEGSIWFIVESKKSLIPDLIEIIDEIESFSSSVETKENYKFITFHQSYSYEDFIEGIKPVLSSDDQKESNDLGFKIEKGVFYEACESACKLAGFLGLKDCIESTKESRIEKFSSAPRFALFIDEINRGNISAIFGELITLIELDKRLGRDEIILELPYSKSKFSVPPNLFIYGTMNTADRSITLLDSALRRRFSFEEIGPEPELLSDIECDGIDVALLLAKLNKRITYFLGKDQCIGHSHFMPLKKSDNPKLGLLRIFINSVIPQLEEYFYNDIGKVRMVLGESDDTFEYNFFERDDDASLDTLFKTVDEDVEFDGGDVSYVRKERWSQILSGSSDEIVPSEVFTKIY